MGEAQEYPRLQLREGHEGLARAALLVANIPNSPILTTQNSRTRLLMRSPLKQPSEIFDPDPRSTSFVRIDATGEHPVTLDDHHGKIAAVQISDAVPEDIRGEFDTVRNLHLHSWYVYEFTVPAVLYAYTLVEKAIKERCARSAIPLKDHQGLRALLQLAIHQGWLTNADFQYALELTREEMTFSADDGHPPTIHSTPRLIPTIASAWRIRCPNSETSALTVRQAWASPQAPWASSRPAPALSTPSSRKDRSPRETRTHASPITAIPRCSRPSSARRRRGLRAIPSIGWPPSLTGPSGTGLFVVSWGLEGAMPA